MGEFWLVVVFLGLDGVLFNLFFVVVFLDDLLYEDVGYVGLIGFDFV